MMTLPELLKARQTESDELYTSQYSYVILTTESGPDQSMIRNK